MKFFTITRLRTITLASLIILIVSGFAIKRLHAENANKASIRDSAVAEFSEAQRRESSVRQSLGAGLTHNGKALPLDSAYVKTMIAVREGASPNLVRVLALTVGNRQLDSKGSSVNEISETTAQGSVLKKIRVRVKGRYESINALQAYLDSIKASPALMKSIDIAKDQFDIEILILGT